jgi:formylglycine-generating enzyme required for sulfatase activity
VLLSPYWLSETPVSWAAFCRLMDWEPPPSGFPRDYTRPAGGFDEWAFDLHNANKIRYHYCDDGGPPRYRSRRAGRADPEPEPTYEARPMVAVSWEMATGLADRLSTAKVRYALPTEAEWEKAARGGLIGKRYSWGDEPPTPARCDSGHFGAFRIAPMKSLPPNGYGLYAMCGGVWEWTRDWYDSDYYRESPDADPLGPPKGKQKVLRGGSWSDCAEAVTITFRMALPIQQGKRQGFGAYFNPNVGFRLYRTVLAPGGYPIEKARTGR